MHSIQKKRSSGIRAVSSRKEEGKLEEIIQNFSVNDLSTFALDYLSRLRNFFQLDVRLRTKLSFLLLATPAPPNCVKCFFASRATMMGEKVEIAEC